MFEAVLNKVTTQGLTAGAALAAAIFGPTVAIIIGKWQFRTENKKILVSIRKSYRISKKLHRGSYKYFRVTL
jgi:hypothetical protein